MRPQKARRAFLVQFDEGDALFRNPASILPAGFSPLSRIPAPAATQDLLMRADNK
jgi:hypothetical protein